MVAFFKGPMIRNCFEALPGDDEHISQGAIRGSGHEHRTAKRRGLGVVRRRRRFGARVVGKGDWKSEGRKQVRFQEQSQRGNDVMLKCEHMDGVCVPPRVGGGEFIHGEGGLSIGRSRYQAKAPTGLPSDCKEGPDGLASGIPL